VFDAVAAGDVYGESARIESFREMTEAVAAGKSKQITVADHYLHIRCELTYEGVLGLFESSIEVPCVRLVSVMDHSPGQRQFASVDKYRLYYQGKYGLDDDQVDTLIRRQCAASERFAQRHRQVIVAACQERNLPLASHDDATCEHIAEAAAEGVIIAEFPTTLEAARSARQCGIHVLMGAPNLVLGGSHSGNVSTLAMARHRLLNTLSSDYVPASLLVGAFVLHRKAGYSLPEAIATVSAEPAATVGLDDRGEIAAGKRADLVRVREGAHSVPLIRGVWREGRRIA
jgi:alpha-D-ribose 1-methylphosphonate 5-triphosphate diphosphatase